MCSSDLRQPELEFQQGAGGSGGVESVATQCLPVVLGPAEQVRLLVVVRDQGYVSSDSGNDAGPSRWLRCRRTSAFLGHFEHSMRICSAGYQNRNSGGVLDHGLRPTAAAQGMSPGSASASSGQSGCHCGTQTTPGSTSSQPSNSSRTRPLDRKVGWSEADW